MLNHALSSCFVKMRPVGLVFRASLVTLYGQPLIELPIAPTVLTEFDGYLEVGKTADLYGLTIFGRYTRDCPTTPTHIPHAHIRLRAGFGLDSELLRGHLEYSLRLYKLSRSIVAESTDLW